MSDAWQKYVAKFNAEPQSAEQLLKFSKSQDSGISPLTFQEAKKIYDSNKGKKSTYATNTNTNANVNNNNNNNKNKTNDKNDDSGGGGLFDELNQGTNITSGLKKVTADMKTKNRADKTGMVPAGPSDKKPDQKVQPKNNDQKKEKSIKKQGPRIMVENYSEGVEELKEADHKSDVNFYKCSNTGFLIPNKVKAVVIDSCNRIQVDISEVISTVELVNCQNVTIYVRKTAPSITIDKSSQPRVFLFDEALEKDPDIITSMVTDMNISVQSGDDWNDIAVPYQFITKINKDTKKATTAPVEHSA